MVEWMNGDAGMRKSWENRTLIGPGYVDYDPMCSSLTGCAKSIKCEGGHCRLLPCLFNSVLRLSVC